MQMRLNHRFGNIELFCAHFQSDNPADVLLLKLNHSDNIFWHGNQRESGFHHRHLQLFRLVFMRKGLAG
jgi:hypothetical protein